MKARNKPRKPPWTYFWKVTPSHKEPYAVPSGGVPEEAIITRGDENSMHAITPENFPVGQDMEVKDSEMAHLDPEWA